jgi:[histone H3]-lysine4 N-trimethyltransferase SETD1
MSRSSKGFADFFPTAPSVLQQKKSRTAQEKKRHESSGHYNSATASGSLNSHSTSAKKVDHRASNSQRNGTSRAASTTEKPSTTHEESDSVPGDLLNGVGSASSTSTASSVFDANGRSHNHNKLNPSNSTPLTQIDSSSPGNSKSPYSKQDGLTTSAGGNGLISESPVVQGARPGKGELKGVKITYDPELDKTISSKERRNRKPQYKDIISDVSS